MIDEITAFSFLIIYMAEHAISFVCTTLVVTKLAEYMGHDFTNNIFHDVSDFIIRVFRQMEIDARSYRLALYLIVVPIINIPVFFFMIFLFVMRRKINKGK